MRTNFLKFDLDSFQGESESEADAIQCLNYALRRIARKIHLVDNNITLNTVTNQQDYDLEDTATPVCQLGATAVEVVRPYYVVINGTTLCGPTYRRGVWTMEQMDVFRPAWRDEAAGIPNAAAIVRGGQYLRLLPKPSASVTSARISGQYIPKALTTSDDAVQLPLPKICHEPLVYLSSVFSAIPNVSEAEGWQRLKAFNEAWMKDIEMLERENLARAAYTGSDDVAMGNDYIHL